MSYQSQVLFAGQAEGDVLRMSAPISFWGGVCASTARVVLGGHPEKGQCISGKILVIPELVGSSSSSAVMLELLHQDIAPAGLVLGETDAILPIGVVVARQMGWHSIPVVVVRTSSLRSGMRVRIATDGQIDVVRG